MLKDLKYYPAVYAVGKDYQIAVYSDSELLVGIKVKNEVFYDHSNGVKRSLKKIHKITVPARFVDDEKGYEVCYRKVIERKGDYTETEEEKTVKFAFKPVPEDGKVRVYQIADAHQKEHYPVRSAGFFGTELDLLVINGDTFDYLNTEKDFEYLLSTISDVTTGGIPVIFAKGNHDNKGVYAEELCNYVGTDCGRSYFTVRLGGIWAMVLDCGENCADDTDFYGNTVCHHGFRKKQTEFIRSVIANAETEYAAAGVTTKLVISHSAFNNVRCKPFDIEVDIYREWVSLINRYVKPQLLLAGHLHVTEFCEPDNELNTLSLNCPFVIGANPVGWQTGKITDFIGTALTIERDKTEILFTDSERRVKERHEVQAVRKVQSLNEYLKVNNSDTRYEYVKTSLPKGYENIRAIEYEVTEGVRAFAYIGIPESPKPVNGYKATVLIHGGQGQAFYEWVKVWNDRGYIAIAPDFSPEKVFGGGANTANDSPTEREYGSVNDFDEKNPWLYRAVLSASRAADILCSLKETEPDEIYAQGISWGGFIALSYAATDKRIKGLSVVYSSAFISDSEWGMAQGLNLLSESDRKIYDENIDPQTRLNEIKCPVLFSTGSDDGAFTMNNRKRTAETIKGIKTFSLRRTYTHGHVEGWKEKEPFYFFEGKLISPETFMRCKEITVKNAEDFVKISLVFTAEDIEKKDICSFAEYEFKNKTVLPDCAKYYFVCAEDKNGCKTSTDVIKN